MSELPSYPRDASEREEASVSDAPSHEYAGWWSRAGATLLDSVVVAVPFLVLGALIGAFGDEDPGASVALLYVVWIVVAVAYYVLLHGGERGQTLGKRATNIRVVATDGSRLGYGRALGRYAIVVVFSVFALPLLLDYLWPLWDDRNQSLHDKVAGSLVVKA